MNQFHISGYVDKSHEAFVKFFEPCRYSAKNFHTLKQVFNEMPRSVISPNQTSGAGVGFLGGMITFRLFKRIKNSLEMALSAPISESLINMILSNCAEFTVNFKSEF